MSALFADMITVSATRVARGHRRGARRDSDRCDRGGKARRERDAGGADAAESKSKPRYQDASAPLEQRVEDLLGRMTLEEKIAQLTTIWTLAVIGPHAAVAQLGGYSNVPRHTVSLLEGIKAKLGNRVRVVTAEGVRLTDKGDWNADEVVLADPQENRRRIQEAVQVAQGADAVVLAVGGSAATSREAWADNHLGDATSIELVGEQNELARALFALGKPVVVVLINGRPQAVAEIAARANALLEGWYLGQEGGTALADILFGDANPGGKLPVNDSALGRPAAAGVQRRACPLGQEHEARRRAPVNFRSWSDRIRPS